MAGGSEKRQRNRHILIRVTEDELAAIEARADASGLSIAAYLRATALGNPGPRARRRPPVNHVVLRQLLGELGRVGNNVNQIARALNSGEAASVAELREALTAYLQLRNAIFVALNMDPKQP